VYLVGFLIRIYHDARSPERQIDNLVRGTILVGLCSVADEDFVAG
jgi:hypothetical protein